MRATNTFKAVYVVFLLVRGYVAVSLSNRIGTPQIFESFYYERLKESDTTIFDSEYFKDVSIILKDAYDKHQRTERWSLVSLCLLILCVFGVLDTFVFQGMAFDIRKYSSILLLIYSATAFSLSIQRMSILSREAILDARARLVTSDKDVDLYRFRFPLKNAPPPFSQIYRRESGDQPTQKRVQMKPTRAANIFLSFFLLYIGLYWVLALYAVLLPGVNPIMRILIVFISVMLHTFSFLGALLLEFAATKNPNAVREYLQQFVTIMQSNKK